MDTPKPLIKKMIYDRSEVELAAEFLKQEIAKTEDKERIKRLIDESFSI
ncbi:hypothetical protein HY500_03660 [Candidatus Woesearchaeota archaeon]|nr:hypothetical protein [Candidatus Woesearchaeota archaeon]